MDNINFSNDLFRRMVQAFKPQSINEVEDVQEAVPFKKHAFGEMKLKDNDVKLKEDSLDEVDPSTLVVGKEYDYTGTVPGDGEGGKDSLRLKYKGTVKDSKGTTYHLFSDDKGSSGVFGDEGIKTNFKTPEESMRAKFDMWRTSLEEEDFDVNDDLKTMSDLGL
jgi:hypothetical protein